MLLYLARGLIGDTHALVAPDLIVPNECVLDSFGESSLNSLALALRTTKWLNLGYSHVLSRFDEMDGEVLM